MKAVRMTIIQVPSNHLKHVENRSRFQGLYCPGTGERQLLTLPVTSVQFKLRAALWSLNVKVTLTLPAADELQPDASRTCAIFTPSCGT